MRREHPPIVRMAAVRHSRCGIPVELRREPVVESESPYMALWCPQCREFVGGQALDPAGSVCVVWATSDERQ